VRPDGEPPDDQSEELGDDQLPLILLCCHPALPPESRSALALRLVVGTPTAQIACSSCRPRPWRHASPGRRGLQQSGPGQGALTQAGPLDPDIRPVKVGGPLVSRLDVTLFGFDTIRMANARPAADAAAPHQRAQAAHAESAGVHDYPERRSRIEPMSGQGRAPLPL
jgi:hypothetical protein